MEANENDPLIPQSPSHSRPSLQSEDSDSSGQDEAYKQKSYLKSPYWWAGIILMTVGEAGNFLAYGFAPASIVSPLGVVALISNCIIAPFMLKEPFRKRDALGVVIAVGGAVTVVLSANDNNPKLGPGEIWKLISTWEFETYLGVTVAVIGLLMVASNRYGDKNILIDLGLVGLFGRWMEFRLLLRSIANVAQVATLHSPQKVSPRCFRIRYGASLLSQSSICSSPS
jgi:drug/metabolite transporter (DMT)-like permease